VAPAVANAPVKVKASADPATASAMNVRRPLNNAAKVDLVAMIAVRKARVKPARKVIDSHAAVAAPSSVAHVPSSSNVPVRNAAIVPKASASGPPVHPTMRP
jgi:hypothetical protein